jgi:3-hydroxyacyl-[acyl-carrier-protein] dehydratase
MPFSSLHVQDLLPHRHPFLFVDKVLSLQPDHRVEGTFRVKDDHPFINRTGAVQVFPASLVVEALGQIAAICIRYPQGKTATPVRPRGFLARIDQCSFEHPVHVGKTLLLTASLVKHFATLYKFEAKGFVDDKIAVKAALTLFLEF